MAYYNTYNGLGVTLTSEQSNQYNNAYGIAYTYNLSAPRMEDFANGNGEAIIDYYAQQAYAKDPNKTGVSWCDYVKQRVAAIAQREAQLAPIGSKSPIPNQSTVQQAATLPPVTIPPTTTKTAKTWKDYLPWFLVGGAVAFGAYKMLTAGKKKRR